MNRHRRVVVGLWLLLLLGACAVLVLRFELDDDLQAFVPRGETELERLLLSRLDDGDAMRLVLVAFAGGDPGVRAAASRAAKDELGRVPGVARVENGANSGARAFGSLFRLRYLLSPSEGLDTEALRSAVGERLAELRSPFGQLVEDELVADPTAAFRGWLLDMRDARSRSMRSDFGVWSAPDGSRAVMLLELDVGGFAGDVQRRLVVELRERLQDIADRYDLSLLLAGAPVLAVESREALRVTVQSRGTAAAVLTLGLILLAYRNLAPLPVVLMTCASAYVFGLAAVLLLFGGIHGIAFAFGITLLGVAIDYPLHLMSRTGRRVGLHAAVRAVRRPLWQGCLTTVAAFAVFAIGGLEGLAQLGCYVAVGLIAAALVATFVAPSAFPGLEARPRAWPRLTAQPPRMLGYVLLAGLAVACASLGLKGEQAFEQDLTVFNPAPPPLKQIDRMLRDDLGAQDLRHLLVVSGPTAEAVLAAEEALVPRLTEARAKRQLRSFDLGARYAPSLALQAERQAALPERGELGQAMDLLEDEFGFRRGTFAPFVAAIETTRGLAPLDFVGWQDAYRGTPLGALLDRLVVASDRSVFGFVTLSELSDARFLGDLTQTDVPGVEVYAIDLVAMSEAAMGRFRDEALRKLAIGAGVLALVLAVLSGRVVDGLLATAVAGGAAVTAAALLVAIGVKLSVFHILAGLLVMGIGVDYTVFVLHARRVEADRAGTTHAILACALSTIIVFGLLATAPFEILRAIGLPVCFGTVFALLAAFALTSPPRGAMRDKAVPI